MSKVCGCCGKILDEIVSDFAYRRPLPFFTVPEAERAKRVQANDDMCIVDGKSFSIRGVMRIPIIDAEPGRYFGWGFWAAVSQRSFERYYALFDADARAEPPFLGRLAVAPPNYASFIDAEVMVQLGTSTERPRFTPTTFAHPLFQEFRDGITTQRWHRILVEIHEYQRNLKKP